MGAGLGFKTFVTGDVLTAADTNGYLMQGVWVFATAAARDAAVTSPQEGNFCYLKDTNITQYYSGAAWTAVGGGTSITTGSADTTANETTTSTTYTGLSTAQTVTVTTGTKVLITLGARLTLNDLTKSAYLACAISGATTIASSDAKALIYTAFTDVYGLRFGISYIETLTAGSNTFTAQYRTNSTSGTMRADNRIMSILCLN